MRKVVLGLGISLDGYIARKNGAVDWLSMDWDYDRTKFFAGVDVVLMGLPLFPELAREIPLRLVSCNVCKHTKEDDGMLELLYEVKR